VIQGKITASELKKVAHELGEDLNDEEIEHIFFKADLDDDGFVTGDDFYNIMTHKVYWEQWFYGIYSNNPSLSILSSFVVDIYCNNILLIKPIWSRMANDGGRMDCIGEVEVELKS